MTIQFVSPQLNAGDRVWYTTGTDDETVSVPATVVSIGPAGVRIRFDASTADGDFEDIISPENLTLAIDEFGADQHPAIDYINTIFRPEDRLCIFLLPSDGKNIDFRRADQVATEAYMQRLAVKNETHNVFVCMNALRPEAKSRTKADIQTIRTVYLDFDDDGQAKVDKVMASSQVPKPTFVVESSPGKFQVIWSVSDVAPQQQEALLAALISTFGGDPACKDCTRVLRLPGFQNNKYAEKPIAKIVYRGNLAPASLSDFRVSDISEPTTRKSPSLTGDKIPHGQHDSELTRIAGKLRAAGMEQESIANALIEVVEKRCEGYGSDYAEMCRKIAKSVCRYAPGLAPTVLMGGKEPGAMPALPATGSPASAQTANIHIPIDEAAFYGLAGRIINKLRPHTESHPCGNLLELLAVFGNVIGPTAYYQVEDSRHYANIFVVRVGKSSKSRKGTGKGRIMRIADMLDPIWIKDRNISGLGSGEVVVYQVRDAAMGQVKDKKTGLLRTEMTDIGVDDKRLFVSEGEFSGILAVAGRKDCTLSKIIRDAWDHLPIRNMAKSGSSICLNPHISISADVTREELSLQLKESDRFNGFGNRFLWPLVERQGLLPHGGEDINWSDEILELYKAVEFARNQKRIFMDRNARLMWERMYDELSEDIPGVIGAVTSRAEAQVIRLSLIFALLDLSDHISTDHLKAARALWQYCDDSARVIFGGVLKNHQRILDFLGKELKSLAEIRDELFHRNRRKEEIEKDLAALVLLGRIITVVGEDGVQRFGVPS